MHDHSQGIHQGRHACEVTTTSLSASEADESSRYLTVPYLLRSLTLTVAHTYHAPDTETQLKNREVNAPLLRYADSMRTHGHRAARIDPLDLLQREEVGALDPSRYGLVDRSKKYAINGIIWANTAGPNSTVSEEWTLDRITQHLRSVYVNRIAYEFMHSISKTERQWFSYMLESSGVAPTNSQSPAQKKRLWELLTRSEVFDQFLQLKFPNLKRYGLEGGESMLPALDSLFSVASAGAILPFLSFTSRSVNISLKLESITLSSLCLIEVVSIC